ncbi:MAG: hypothetical protein EOO86_12925 [Pedobacter sp.]|nr:MAG: hypothetical protein EOO86_12925 [Pedobacter sp.]
MKKQFIVLFSLLSITIGASAQKEYKLNKSSGKLNLYVPGAVVEGYNGNEIIFSLPKRTGEIEDERAKGLRMITASGFVDNTGLGLDVSEKGSEINVNAVNKSLDGVLTIKVPQNVKVFFENKSNMYQDQIILKNLKSEIEISTSYNAIKLENNTGPMNVKTLFGGIDATFDGAITGPVSIVSVYGIVDVALPSATKANVELFTSYGKLYAADALKIVIDKSAEKEKPEQITIVNTARNATDEALAVAGVKLNSGNATRGTTNVTIKGVGLAAYGGRSSEEIKGTLNGGGANLILKSSYSNVYLRTK